MASHSTKIKEVFDDDKMIIKNTFDATHMLKDAEQAREVTSAMVLVQIISTLVMSIWHCLACG